MIILANELSRLATKVDLVVGSSKRLQLKGELSDRVNLIQLGRESAAKAIFPLAIYLRRSKPQALLVTMHYTALASKIAMLLVHSPPRLFIREALSPAYRLAKFHKPTQHLQEWMTRWAYRRADCVISISKSMTTSLRQTYGLKHNLVTILNPVITPDFMTKAQQPPEFPLPWPEHGALVVAAGRLKPQKDFATLIRSFAILRHHYPELEAKLIILGTGEELPNLKQLIMSLELSDHVWFPGFVNNPLPYFRMADLYVLSSLGEGSPNTLVQALACGTRAVSTDCPTGPSEILADTNLGQLVPIADEQAMHQAMAQSLLHPVALSNADLEFLQPYKSEYSARKYLEAIEHRL